MGQWLQTKTHISWHLAGAAFGVVAGCAGSRLASPRIFSDELWLLVLVAFAMIIILSRKRYLLVVAVVAGLLAGVARGSYALLALEAYAPYYSHTVTFQGVLSEDSAAGRHGDQRLLLKDIRLYGRKLPGKVWVSTANQLVIKRGDELTVRGELDKGFNNLPASMHRGAVIRVQRPQPGDVAGRVRDWFASGVRKLVPEPEASLGIGYLTGQRSTLPPELDEQLQTAGLTHAVVASGYNLTILVAFARQWLLSVSKYIATLSAASMIGCFILITGVSPSMSRAGLVTAISLATWYYGRTIHPFVLLPLAAAITVLIDPSYVWGDIGWCLSFAAFAGVSVLGPLIRSYFWPPDHTPPNLINILIDTTAAQAMTLPLILYVFGQYAAYALPANMLVLPLIPLAMLCTFGAGIAGVALPGLGLLGLPATSILHYMIWVVAAIANLPGAQENIAFDWFALLGSYFLLLLICFYLWRKTGFDFRSASRQKYI